MKHSFFHAAVVSILLHYMDTNKTAGEEARWQLHKNAAYIYIYIYIYIYTHMAILFWYASQTVIGILKINFF